MSVNVQQPDDPRIRMKGSQLLDLAEQVFPSLANPVGKELNGHPGSSAHVSAEPHFPVTSHSEQPFQLVPGNFRTASTESA